MGALHAGHVSLIERAAAESDEVIVTIFVNPRQFDDPGDLAAYPSDLAADADVAEATGATTLVVPTLAEMWPHHPAPTPTTVHVSGLADVLEGEGRPGHFDGVASVVVKLLVITGTCRAYFGEKDFQQLAVVRQVVSDLALDAEIVGCPIVRDEDGLALSSRNRRLSAEGRERARGLSAVVIAAGARTWPNGPEASRAAAEQLALGGVEVAYAEVVDPATLRPLVTGEMGPARLLVAGRVEGVRLIDNGPVTIAEGD
jgi:pantoate--beta-alanine ligase